MNCEYLEECRNANNDIKCGNCERNPNNFEKIKKDDETPSFYKALFYKQKIKRTPGRKKFYSFRDNYEPF